MSTQSTATSSKLIRSILEAASVLGEREQETITAIQDELARLQQLLTRLGGQQQLVANSLTAANGQASTRQQHHAQLLAEATQVTAGAVNGYYSVVINAVMRQVASDEVTKGHGGTALAVVRGETAGRGKEVRLP